MMNFRTKLLAELLTMSIFASLGGLTSASAQSVSQSVLIQGISSLTPGNTSSSFAGGVTLGSAGPEFYTVLSLGGQGSSTDNITHTNVTFNNQSTVQGNVGVPAVGNLSTTGNAFINGTLFLNTSANWNRSGTSGAASVQQNAATDAQLNQAVQDALNASQQAAALPSTQPSITNINLGDHAMMTINGTGQDVINLTNFVLGNQASLTLNAPAGDSFIFNISGNFADQGLVLLTGGITPDDVLFNVTGAGSAVQFSGGGNQAQFNGILLAPLRDIQLSPGLVTGEIIGGGNILTLTSGADAVPEASTTMLLLAGATLLGAIAFRRRKEALQS
jgi:PEP-CTERM motif